MSEIAIGSSHFRYPYPCRYRFFVSGVVCGPWSVVSRPRTLDLGPWTLDIGRWTSVYPPISRLSEDDKTSRIPQHKECMSDPGMLY